MTGQLLLTEHDTTSGTEPAQCHFLAVPSDAPQAAPIKRYIRTRFARSHGAQIEEFLPQQLAILCGDRIKAAAGLRIADDAPLFIEQYLDISCEQEIATHFRVMPPERGAIAEVGNLAGSESAAVRELFFYIAATAHTQSLAWLTCNATLRVQAILRYMRLPFSRIRAADPSRIDNVERWGTYYDRPSHVMAAPVDGILEAMAHSDPVELALAEHRVRAMTPKLNPGPETGAWQ